MDQKHAVGVAPHRIEHAPARLFEPQEKRQDRKQNSGAEGDEEQAVARLVPIRLHRRIPQDFALDGDQHPQ